MNDLPVTEESGARAVMRSGTAARLAGLSPSTLRIWEHRYGVVSPPKSASGQRTYSMADVQRLRLIKRLTLQGHAIGTVARLDVDALLLLSSGSPVSLTGEQRVLVVGQAAARKLEGRLRPPSALVFDDLDHAERDIARCGAADVLVVHVPSLHPSVIERVQALRTNLPAPAVIVVYSFGPEAVAERLRAAGATLRREPVTGQELARLVAAARPVPAALAVESATQAGPRPRRYSDAELSSLMETSTSVACECPRHLAEIVTLLTSFELYSTECVLRSETDATLHRHLNEVAGVARTLFEQALARVLVEEGLVV